MRVQLPSIVPLALVGLAGLCTSCGSAGGGAPGAGNPATVQMHVIAPPSGTTGVAYTHQFSADFPHEPGFFIVTGGALPTGVQLDAFTGIMTGFPRQVGTFQVEIAARDGVDKSLPQDRDVTFAEDRRLFTIQVDRGLPQILPQVVPAGQFHTGYSYQIDAAGGYPPYTFEQIGGTLPAGMEVLPTGELIGFPDQFQAQPYEFEVRVTDSAGQSDVESLEIQIFVLPLVIAMPTLPTAVVGDPYDVVLQLASPGGGTPYAWSQAPLQPGDDVVLDAIGMEITSDGHLRVKAGFPGPTLNGNFTFTVQVVDDAAQVATLQMQLKIVLGPVLVSITPNRSTATGPFLASGANFQPGATLTFKPGATEQVITPTWLSPALLSFPTAPPKPGGAGGVVAVRVDNPDGGSYTLANAFTFPASTISFGAKGLVPSALSSTGLDAADVTGDGRADLVHCGAVFSTYTYGAGVNGPTGTAPGLVFHLNGGGAVPSFGSTTIDPASYWDVKFLDVNADGKLDIVALAASGVRTWFNGVSGNPLGTFSAGPTSPYPTAIPYPSSMAVGNFDGDGLPDLAISGSSISSVNGRVYTMKGNNTGGFTTLSAHDTTLPGTTYGVVSLCCPDLNADGRSDVFAGRGFVNGGGSFLGFYALTNVGGQIPSWSTTSATGTAYSNTLGVAAADFLGDGTPAAVVVHTQDAQDGGARTIRLLSGSNLGSITSLTAPAGLGKCVAAFDGDFDAKMDWAISTQTGGVAVYRGATQALLINLELGVGTPTVTSPRSGRIASADIDGDGRNDLLVTTSYWQIDYQPSLWSGSYSLALAGNGGTMGIVYYLNTSN